MAVSKTQKKYLAGICHHLRPVVMLGQKGLTDAVFEEIEIALTAHELVKLKLRGEREDRRAWAEEIVSRTDAELIQQIGMTACFYRANPDKPKIELPR
ncbi:MAG: ribosome assembly RNA-binding protein YhbY [Pseudomonadota bacterium]